jgi:P27 family predicted phage terminase small subunit
MGTRGPKSRSAVLAFQSNETRPSRVNRDEPDLPAAKATPPPASLKGEGRREWLRLAPQLLQRGLLREADLSCFEDYCRALSDLRAYEHKARKVGLERAIAAGFQGMTVKLRAQVASLRNHLGLTPVSRASVRQVGGGASSSPKGSIDAFLAQKRGRFQ